MTFKPNLDLLRSMAVLFVVIDHSFLANGIQTVGRWSTFWLGDVGVYMFFVHTCLVLMWSLERKPHTLDFYIRRVFRIYPLAWVAILCVFLFHAPVMGYFNHPPHPLPVRSLLETLALMQNLGRGLNVIGVLWTLPLEIQMYLFLPALFFFVRNNFSLWPVLLLWAFLVVFVHQHFSSSGNDFAVVVPDFLCGVMAYITYRRRTPVLPGWTLPFFVVLLTALYLLKPNTFRSWPFCLALGLGLASFRQIRAPWLVRASHEVAKYSYGIYLFHSFALVLAFYLLPGKPLVLQLAIEFAAIAVFSVTGYHLVEKPMINLGSRLAARAEARYEQRELTTVYPAPSA